MSDDEDFSAYDQNSEGFQVKLNASEQENRRLETANNYSIPQINYENLRKDFNEFKAYTESKLRKIGNALKSNENIDKATTVSQSSLNSITDTNIKLIWNQLSSIEQKINEKFDSEFKESLKNMAIDFKEKISNIDCKSEELKEILEDLEENSKQNDNKIGKVLRDSTEHESKIENLDKDLHKVNGSISGMETKQTQLLSNLGKNNNSLNSNRKELDDIYMQLKSSSNKIDTLENNDLSINRMVTELDQSQNIALESINTLKGSVELLNNNLSALDKQQNKSDQKINKLSKNHDKLYNSLLEIEHRLKQNETLANDIEKWKDETSKRLDSSDRDEDKFRADTSRKFDKLDHEFKELSVAKNLMEDTLRDLINASAEVKRRVEKLDCLSQDQAITISQLKQEFENCIQKITKLENKIDINDQTLNQLKADNSSVQEKQIDLSSTVAKIEGTKSALLTKPQGYSSAASGFFKKF